MQKDHSFPLSGMERTALRILSGIKNPWYQVPEVTSLNPRNTRSTHKCQPKKTPSIAPNGTYYRRSNTRLKGTSAH